MLAEEGKLEATGGHNHCHMEENLPKMKTQQREGKRWRETDA